MSVVIQTNRTVDLDQPIRKTELPNLFVKGNDSAHEFNISVVKNGVAESLASGSCSALFVNAAKQTVVLGGSVSSNVATVTLNDACYAVAGRFYLVINASVGGVTQAVFYGVGSVAPSETTVVIDPDDIVPSLPALMAQIANCEAAEDAALSAAALANDVVDTFDPDLTYYPILWGTENQTLNSSTGAVETPSSGEYRVSQNHIPIENGDYLFFGGDGCLYPSVRIYDASDDSYLGYLHSGDACPYSAASMYMLFAEELATLPTMVKRGGLLQANLDAYVFFDRNKKAIQIEENCTGIREGIVRSTSSFDALDLGGSHSPQFGMFVSDDYRVTMPLVANQTYFFIRYATETAVEVFVNYLQFIVGGAYTDWEIIRNEDNCMLVQWQGANVAEDEFGLYALLGYIKDESEVDYEDGFRIDQVVAFQSDYDTDLIFELMAYGNNEMSYLTRVMPGHNEEQYASNDVFAFTSVDVDWESGDLEDGNVGENIEDVNRMRTAGYLLMGGGSTIKFGSQGDYVIYYFLYDENKDFVSYSGSYYDEDYTVAQDCFVRIVIRRSSESEITESEFAALAATVTAKTRAVQNGDFYAIPAGGSSDEGSLPAAATLESHWLSHIDTKLGVARGYQRACGRNAKTFIHWTDMHRTADDRGSNRLPGIVNELQNRIPAHYAIDGGDTFDNEASEALAIERMYQYNELIRDLGTVFLATGNHDDNYYGTGQLTNDEIHSVLHLKYDEQVSWSGLDSNDFYFDDDAKKIRILVMDTHGLSASAEISDEHLTWVANTVLSIGTGWSLIVFSHKFLGDYGDPMLPTSDPDTAMVGLLTAWQNGSTYTNATYSLDVDYSGSHGTILGWITGHFHYDDYNIISGVPFIAMTCFANLFRVPETGDRDYEGMAAATGTINEHAVTVISIDPDNAKLYSVRIGRGVDRIFNSGQTAVGVAGNEGLTSIFTSVSSWVSDDTDVATVLEGTVTGVSAGTAHIQAIDADGNFEVWQVIVS